MISKIFHIADLHIRRGNHVESRFMEYSDVFDTLLQKIKCQYIPDESILVICGDIFHHKLQISPPGIKLFNKFVGDLAKLLPVFIIQGNHDMLQEDNAESHDIIEAMLTNNPNMNVTYLQKTGCYEYQNINFGVVSIQEMLNIGGSSGMAETLPVFPKPHATKINIALSHCTVKNCYMHNYTKQTHGVPIEWFSGYKLVLLGDIHLQSTKYNEKNDIYYGYPGSLLQQDFGESIFNHGFLCWDISREKISVTKHHVKNKIAKANIKIENNVLVINGRDYIPIADFLSYEDKPDFIQARMYIKDDVVNIRNNLIKEFNSHGIQLKVDIMSPQLSISPPVSPDACGINMSSLNSISTVIEFINTKIDTDIAKTTPDWRKYVTTNENFKIPYVDNLPVIISTRIEERNHKITKMIDDSTSKFENIVKSSVLSIKQIKFDWILAYGKQNEFQFENGRIVLVNAPNGYGKSAFFECILLGLFGEPIPSRYNKSSSLSIICKKKPLNTDTAYIEITFTIDEHTYIIKRKFLEAIDVKNKNISRLHCKNVELFLNGERIKTGSNVVNKYVEDNVCSINDFLLSTMITQNSDNDFFRMKASEQITLLDSVLNIDHVNELCDNMKNAKKEYKYVKSHIDTCITSSKPDDVIIEDSEGLENQYRELNKRIANLSDELDYLKVVCNIDPPEQSSQSVRPEESPHELVERMRDIEKNINILDFTDVPVWFDYVDDITIDQFIIQTEYNYSTSVYTDLSRPINKTIVELNALREELQVVCDEIMCHSQWNSHDTVSTFTGYNAFQNKLKKHTNSCETWLSAFDTIPQEPKVDSISLEKLTSEFENSIDLSLLTMTESGVKNKKCILNKSLNAVLKTMKVCDKPTISYDISKEFVEKEVPTMVYSDSCWACDENSKNMNKQSDVCKHEDNLVKWNNYNIYIQTLYETKQIEATLLHLENLEMYKTQADMYTRMKDECIMWDNYTKNKDIITYHINIMRESENWESSLPAIKRYETWKQTSDMLGDRRTEISHKIANSQHSLKTSYIYQRKSNALIRLHTDVGVCKSKLSYYISTERIKKKEMNSCSRMEKDLFVKINAQNQLIDKQTLFDIQEEVLLDYSNKLKNSIELFDHLISILKKYKSWVYNEKLLPLIVAKTNKIVAHMFVGRPLELRYKFYEDNVIVWTVFDDDNVVNMEKISGAQSFAISLSFRLALSSIGISKFRCNQLFIDEGFCSFDKQNLTQVPKLITNLKNMFDEIIIVTHLDEVKKSANVVVNILRDGSVSKLQHKSNERQQ
jgi:ABC-type Mn2+/Zn2+ transport system ATPase subunit